MEPQVPRLADVVLETAATVRLDELPYGPDAAVPDGPSWFVVVTEDGAIAAALSADELAGLPPWTPAGRALNDTRAIVTAHPDCTVVAAISSWAVIQAAGWASQSEDRSVAIVVRGDAGVAGVWAGSDLDEELEIGTIRTGVDVTLPGPVRIPEYVRRCAFEARGARCDAVRSFAEPPARAWPCANPRHLPEHEFEE